MKNYRMKDMKEMKDEDMMKEDMRGGMRPDMQGDMRGGHMMRWDYMDRRCGRSSGAQNGKAFIFSILTLFVSMIYYF